jgi:TonB family protein
MRVIAAACAIGYLTITLSGQPSISPARYRSGPIPTLPAISASVGGGQVLLEVTVGSNGEVAAVTPLRTTASFTELTVDAVRGWQFFPARPRGASHVLVAAVYRPPALNAPTLGEPVEDVAAGSGETPIPLSMVTPPFPPRARDSGVVLVEAQVSAAGAVVEVRVVRSAAPFDGSARDAARQWRFRPARVGGRPVAAFVYILFGFPQPVV